MANTRDYIYYDYTKSLCPECLMLCDAKIVFQDAKKIQEFLIDEFILPNQLYKKKISLDEFS